MKHLMRTAICALALLMFSLKASPSPWDSWRSAYSCFEQGESYRDKGDYIQALKSFEEALQNYRAVKRARPDWNQRVITMRIERCRTECEKMRRLLGKNAPEAAGTGRKPAAEVIPELPQKSGDSVELRDARTKLQQAALELRDLRRQQETTKKYENEIANLMRDLRISKEENALLTRRYKMLEEKLGNPDSGSDKLKNQLAEAEMRYQRLKKQYDSTVLRLRSLEESNLNQAGLHKAAENAVIKLRDENEKLRKTMADIRSQSNENESRIKILQHDLKEAQRRLQEQENISAASQQGAKSSGEEVARLKAAVERQTLLLRDAVKKQSELEQKLAASQSSMSELESKYKSTRELLEHERRTAGITAKELEQLRKIKNSLESELARVSDDLNKSEKRISDRNSKDFIALTKAEKQVRELQAEIDRAKQNSIKFKVNSEDSKKEIAKLSKALDAAKIELRRITAERNMLAEQESKQRARLVKLEDAAADLAKLRKNFEALSAENRENRRLIEASKPREAEITRIKLRLAELDRLNDKLNREQRLNEELKSVNHKLEKELAETANVRNEFYAARKRLTELEPLTAEVERLKKLNAELADAKKFEPQVVALQAKLASLEPMIKELDSLRKLNQRMISDRNELEKEVSRIRNMHTGTQLLENELKELRERYDKLASVKNEVEARCEQLLTRLAALESIEKDYEHQKRVNRQLVASIPAPEEMTKLRAAKHKADELEKSLAAQRDYSKGLSEVNKKMQGELSRLRLVMAELRQKHGKDFLAGTGVSVDDIPVSESAKFKKYELEISNLKQQLAAAAEREKQISSQQNFDYGKVKNILSGNASGGGRQVSALEARCIELESELKKNNQELARLRNDIRRVEQIQSELALLKKRNSDLSDENNSLKGKMRTADASSTELERLRNEAANLRKLLVDFEKAKRAESELAQLKLKYSEFDQLKEELARVNRLNRELYARRDVLEKELRERPRYGVGRVNAPVIKVKGKPEDFTNSGKIAEADGNLELAMWNFEEALKIDPAYPEAIKRAASLALRRGDFARSSELYSIMREKDPANRKLAFELAKSYAGEQRYGNALAILESMRAHRVNDPEFQEIISDVYFGSGRFADAEQCIKMAIRLKKNSHELKIKLAKIIVKSSSSRLTEAASIYEEARAMGASADIDLEPKLGKMLDERSEFERFLFEAAREAQSNNDWQGSQWYYRQLIELGKNLDKYIPRLAFARYMCNDPAAVETISFNSKSPLGNIVLTLIHLKNNDIKQAVLAAKEAKFLNKGKPVEIPDDWHELAVELKLRLDGAKGEALKVISSNFTVK
ncbi:MAG: hypothetical protein J6W67_10565 [Lentisphaeria bacterium]|nr:hypothetical protein [Lentisphaeria bacterium]